MTAGDLDDEARVNLPAPRHDARAPVAVLLGVAGVAALAWLARRRVTRLAAEQATASTLSGRGLPAVLIAGAVVGSGALTVRRIGLAKLVRYAPVIRAGIGWMMQPQPMLRGGLRHIRIGDVLRLMGGSRGKQARLAMLALAGGALTLPLVRQRGDRPDRELKDVAATIAGARKQLHVAAALLGLAVLADSGLEHYRACFENPAMYTPLVASSLTILVNLHALAGDGASSAVRNTIHIGAGAIGIIGLGFHLYNIGKRPGGYAWLNFFYGAPFGAPVALMLAALIGYAAEQLDAAKAPGEQRIVGLPFGPTMAVVISGGLIGTVAEVGLLHFRGAFHNPFMYLPVSLPPVAAALMAKQALAPGDGDAWITRGWLWGTVVLGIGGIGFHAYGVSRNMGGWYNWSQNILAGPPLPAPPSFSALALAALAVLDVIEASR